MNTYYIEPQSEVPKIGKITYKGGENPVDKMAEIIELIPNSTSSKKELESFERLTNISLQEMKVVEKEIVSSIKNYKESLRLLQAEKQYVPIKVFEEVFDFDKNLFSKRKVMQYLITKRKITPKDYKAFVKRVTKRDVLSMISLQNDYEIEDGDKMRIKRIKNRFGQNDYKVVFGNSSRQKEGKLKMKDILALYFSRKIYMGPKNEEKLVFSENIASEEVIISNLVRMINDPRKRVVVRIDQRGTSSFIPFGMLERRVLTTNGKNKDAVSFVLNIQGEAVKINNCSYFNADNEDESREDNWIDLKAVSYNMLDYESNHAVVIGRRQTLNHIEHKVNELHEEYYSFTNKNDEEIIGLNGLSDYDKKCLKKMKNGSKGFDESEILEIFEIFKERRADGRLRINGSQSRRNIEHDIRNHENMKYIAHKSSDELYFLKTALEDAVDDEIGGVAICDSDYANHDFLNSADYDNLLKALKRESKKVNKKKLQALINVVSGLHLRYEDEEDMGKYLSDELDEIDKTNSERNFLSEGSYKTHRKYYSQTEGVLVPYGNPQKTHKRKSNPPSMDRIRKLRSQHRNVVHGKYAGISDPQILSKTYTLDFKPRNKILEYGKGTYSRYVQKTLGVQNNAQDVETIQSTMEELKNYLSKDFRIEFFLETRKMYPSRKSIEGRKMNMKFVKPKEDLSTCNNCPHEGECFAMKAKKRGDLLQTLPTLTDFGIVIGNLREHRLEKEFGKFQEKKNGFRFYTRGNLDALNFPSISIAGTRKPHPKTEEFVQKIVDKYSDEYVIISGLAEGCDTIAHERCLDNNGITIAVLPCGFDNIYPRENKALAQRILDNGGLLISEYGPRHEAKKSDFVQRNRIISGLSDKVIICEGGKGTAHTKRFAERQGKEILVQPSPKKYYKTLEEFCLNPSLSGLAKLSKYRQK